MQKMTSRFIFLTLLFLSTGSYVQAMNYTNSTTQNEADLKSLISEYQVKMDEISSNKHGQLYKGNAEINEIYTKFSTNLLQAYKNGFSKEDIQIVLAAAQYAADAHKDDCRKNVNKTPYLVHPLSVANQIMEHANTFSSATLVSGLLHDVPEKTSKKLPDIELDFGLEIKEIVASLTDDKTLTTEQQKEEQKRKAPFLSEDATKVKISDKMHNLKDLFPDFWKQNKAISYCNSAKTIVYALNTNHLNPGFLAAFDSAYEQAIERAKALPLEENTK